MPIACYVKCYQPELRIVHELGCNVHEHSVIFEQNELFFTMQRSLTIDRILRKSYVILTP